jgi:hypothetical protein
MCRGIIEFLFQARFVAVDNDDGGGLRGEGFGNDAERFVCIYVCMLCAVPDDVGGGFLIEKIEGFSQNRVV